MSPLSWWFDYWAGAFDAYLSHMGTWRSLQPSDEHFQDSGWR